MDNNITIADSIIDRYEILTPFDSDENVFLVRDRLTKELLVEKNILVHNLNLYQQLKARPLKGVPKIYQIESVNEKTILIEEYIHGLNLMQIVLNQGPFPETGVASYMVSLCDILGQFHAMSPPVIHRDIKPGNIILSNNDEIYLIDFNISREYKSYSSVDTVSMVSHHFSAPESYGFGQTDVRSDIYSIGATMHFLLTGGYLKETDYYGELKHIINKCTEMAPERRYQSVGELRAALIRYAGASADRKEVSIGSMQSDQARTVDHRENDWKSYLPPGFRSGNPINMLVASIVYALIAWMCFTMEIESTIKGPLSLIDLWMERICLFLFFILSLLVVCNYRGCLDRLPGISKIPSRVVKILLSLFILLSLMMGVIVLFVTVMSSM